MQVQFLHKQSTLIKEVSNNKMAFNNLVINTTNTGSRIGSKLLQYGKVTLDYKKRLFYFEAFNNINTNELSEKPWSILPTMQNDKYVVGVIWDKALESQVNLGDEILKVNGIDIQSLVPCDIVMYDFRKSGEKRILELIDIKTREVKVVEIKRLKDILWKSPE